jgi:outer membrane immunogenic protein
MELEKEKMKKALLTAVSLVALGMAPAFAADLPARTYTKAPVAVAAINNWSGFYLGAMGGYAEKGGLAGGTVGYNWQTGALVFGIEADGAWSNAAPSLNVTGAPLGLTFADKIDAMGTVRGRIGYAFDQVLVYGTGGYAWADNKVTATNFGASSSDSHTLNGWAAGAGVEVMFAPKWSVKAEYLYRRFESQNYTFPAIGVLQVADPHVNSVQVGVNYHF